ncbi:MAG: thioredoxin family protein [Candidatus Bathyarchaeota archaeon]|nr:MAG: thioredoxin family protein [Candidatus Bathyarchaeota archaeon]
MKLLLFTQPNCPRCPSAKLVAEAVAKSRDDISLEILDISDPNALTTALMMQVVSTPSFAIDEVPVFVGVVPSRQQLLARIDEYKTENR